MATCLSEVACVAQLQKVFARVGLLDACIRVVLKSQADFVFQLLAKEIANADMAGKVEAGRKVSVICEVAAIGGIAHANACVYKPG